MQCSVCLEDFSDPLPRPRGLPGANRSRSSDAFHGCPRPHAACVRALTATASLRDTPSRSAQSAAGPGCRGPPSPNPPPAQGEFALFKRPRVHRGHRPDPTVAPRPCGCNHSTLTRLRFTDFWISARAPHVRQPPSCSVRGHTEDRSCDQIGPDVSFVFRIPSLAATGGRPLGDCLAANSLPCLPGVFRFLVVVLLVSVCGWFVVWKNGSPKKKKTDSSFGRPNA